MKEVSVIIPVYNLKGRIEPSIASVLEQDFSDLEIILVDDASSDGSADIASDILEKSGRSYKIIRHKTNLGVSTARNDGLRTSCGKYVVFIDGDDMLEKNFISALHNAIKSTNSDYAACGYQTLDRSTGDRKFYFLDVLSRLRCHDILSGRILHKIEISHWTILYRRSFLLENNLFYADGCCAGEDIEFLIKMLCHNPRGTFVRDCLYIYVLHERMGSRGSDDKAWKLPRYEQHTEAYFREAEYIASHTENKKLRILADNMLLPLGWLRRLSVSAMKGDLADFRKTIASREVRRILFSSHKSFVYKPEVFARALIALLAPSLYYRKYNNYLGSR